MVAVPWCGNFGCYDFFFCLGLLVVRWYLVQPFFTWTSGSIVAGVVWFVLVSTYCIFLAFGCCGSCIEVLRLCFRWSFWLLSSTHLRPLFLGLCLNTLLSWKCRRPLPWGIPRWGAGPQHRLASINILLTAGQAQNSFISVTIIDAFFNNFSNSSKARKIMHPCVQSTVAVPTTSNDRCCCACTVTNMLAL